MATVKITDLTAYTDPKSTDVLPIVDVTNDITKKVDIAAILKNAPLGSAAAPSFAIDGDPNTGIYSPGADQLAIATAGTQHLTVDASGNVNVGTSSPTILKQNGDIDFASNYNGILSKNSNYVYVGSFNNGSALWADTINNTVPQVLANTSSVVISTSNTERLRIDSSGRLLVGTTTTRNNLFAGNAALPAYHLIEGALDNGKRTSAFVYGAGSNSGPLLVLAAHSSNSVGATTAVTNGWEVGTIDFQGADGTNFVPAARIAALVDGTPGTNDMPGRLVFSTTADGASSPTERLRIDSSGNVGIGTASPSCRLDVTSTDAIKLAAGTTAQRPGSPSAGMIRYNTTLGQFEGYGTAWGSIGGGATGGGSDRVFQENDQTVTTNYTITSGRNASSAGPVTINTGVTVTIPSGSNWAII